MFSPRLSHEEKPPGVMDVEMGAEAGHHLTNDVVSSFSWDDLRVEVKDRKAGRVIPILEDATGNVLAGEVIAIMGPSGSGKTTLLSALANRLEAVGSLSSGRVLMNERLASWEDIKNHSTFVEQEDALIGSLTVTETIDFAARLTFLESISKTDRMRRVQDLIFNFGLQEQRNTIVGTPIAKGLSGGQKKRLSIASRLVTNPRIVFLDEPTSGLDSTLASEVMGYVKRLAKKHKLIVIASIHQPSTSVFQSFDKLCLLSKGRTCYFGPVAEARGYFAQIGFPMPEEINPAEFYLDLVNTDLARPEDSIHERRDRVVTCWQVSDAYASLRSSLQQEAIRSTTLSRLRPARANKGNLAQGLVVVTLFQRSLIKARRDVVVYGIRVAMYLGLAVLMGTVFLRLQTTQTHIQPFVNAIFFGGAFMSFMAVAYVPAFLEDRATFIQERANGLVEPFAFTVANFLVGLPFLFAIALLFSLVQYWLSNFRPEAHAFFMNVLWLFLDLLAAESLVVLVSAVFPIFVVALAVTAFANGLWMCVDGFLVPMNVLNPFWKYVFHYIDYQAYVFQGMMVNEFKARTYSCDKSSTGNGYQCMYASPTNAQGKIEGVSVLHALRIKTGREGQWLGIMVAIIAVYRILGYVVLRLRSH